MIIHLSTAVRNARLTVLINAIDANASPGYIEFYTATQPATGGADITTQTLLGTCVLSKPSGTVSTGELIFAAIADDAVADNSGDLAWARFYDGAGTWIMDADCGDSGSTALIKFNLVGVLAGGVIKILSGSLTDGNA